MEFEVNESIGVFAENGEFENVDTWLYEFYEKEFITKNMYDFFISKLKDVSITGGFKGFSRMMFSGMEVTMYTACISYKNEVVIELNEDETVLDTVTTVIWSNDFIKTYNLQDERNQRISLMGKWMGDNHQTAVRFCYSLPYPCSSMEE